MEQNPNELHYMQWPTCDLYDAIVWSPKSSHKEYLIDLLDVLERGPFNVRGRINSIPDELKEFGNCYSPSYPCLLFIMLGNVPY